MSKKENILTAALDLFAKQGVAASSTRAIALQSGVSEGLIFRHFANKEALLTEVLKKGIAQIEDRLETVLHSEHPKVVLKQILSVPFQLNLEEKTFWRLLLCLQWTDPGPCQRVLAPLKNRIEKSFKILDREDPKTEADSFLLFFKAIISCILLESSHNAFGMVNMILDKFDVL
ncbi:TetR/AcrR family transcriptional regulator [Flavobacteriaceae bacterium]|nr:TetR/AcrR family transcriptional regulator [Flavobacteriaceae bacterium]